MHTLHGSRPTFEVSVTIIMIFQVAALFARSMLELALIHHGFGKAVAADLSYLVVPPILLPLMYPYLARCGDSLRALLHPADLTLRVVLLGVALGLTLRVLHWATLTLRIWLGIGTGYDPNAVAGPLLGFDCPASGPLLLSFVVMAMLIPVIEEAINRGFILHAVLPRGKALAIVTSALLFASMHPPPSYAITFAAGLVFAVQALNFRTLWASIVAHATYNAAAVVDWECFRMIWNPPPADPTLRMLTPPAAAITVLGTLLVIYLVSEKAAGRHEPASGPSPESKGVRNALDDV